MKKFWWVSCSVTVAMGWVALTQASGQAMDEAVLDPEIPAPDFAPPALAVESATPMEAELMAPELTAPPEPTWIISEPQPQISYYVESTSRYIERVDALPEASIVTPETREEPVQPTYNVASDRVETTPASQPRFIEQDPIIRAVINPQTPEEEALAAQLAPEDIIRDGRSFEEVLSSSPETPEFRPPSPPADVPPAAPAVQPSVNRTTPLRTPLEQAIATMQQDVHVEQVSPQLVVPTPQPLTQAVTFETSPATLSQSPAELSQTTAAIAPHPLPNLALNVWDVATLGATFTRNEFNRYTFGANFFPGQAWLTTDWETVGLETFNNELKAQLTPDWAVEVTELAIDTIGMLPDEAFPLKQAALSLPSFAPSGQLVLDFSAFDAVTFASPLGLNPLTFGYEEDVLVASVLDVIRSPH